MDGVRLTDSALADGVIIIITSSPRDNLTLTGGDAVALLLTESCRCN